MISVRVRRNADGVEMVVSLAKFEQIKGRFTLVEEKSKPKKTTKKVTEK